MWVLTSILVPPLGTDLRLFRVLADCDILLSSVIRGLFPSPTVAGLSKSTGMFRKKEVFTVITPIPGLIPRQLAIDILHSHSEVITLNPLVLDHKPIPAPRDVKDQDEYFSTWYEISQRIQYVPGIGKMGAGDLKFTGCFHNLPCGLQTHMYVMLWSQPVRF